MRIWYKICSKLTLQEDISPTDTQEMMLFLYRATNCPTEAEKINMQKWINWLRRASNETKYNRISFLVLYYGWYLRKQRKIKAKNSCKNQLKTRNQIISSLYEGIILPYWYLISRVLNFAILARQYFAGFYFRDFNRQIWKKGIKFRDWSVLNFILFFQRSELFKVSR